ncbi:MAG: tRNA (adenosine(37)-N6)-threonylcarbamoyltransferase complex ATPase subunit type 1 TsaE [Alphaproteobacteria bacterium]|nr:tRNA (adenosine(37)-N6)-threonylcarbamoyltransferase complex ATPase subunit type 1 TsaE [Alphaproteobacteria bacterium]
MEWVVSTERDLDAIADTIAPLLSVGDVVALNGTLGVGKTTFVRALVRNLTHTEADVPSPTFTILQTYDTPKFTLYHFDFYRLKSPEEAYEIGIEEAFTEGVSVIEWPEKIGSLLPKQHKAISFEILKDGTRHIWTENF